MGWAALVKKKGSDDPVPRGTDVTSRDWANSPTGGGRRKERTCQMPLKGDAGEKTI